jgi:hypothetical protein
LSVRESGDAGGERKREQGSDGMMHRAAIHVARIRRARIANFAS